MSPDDATEADRWIDERGEDERELERDGRLAEEPMPLFEWAERS